MDGSLDTNVLLRFACKDVADQFEQARDLLALPDARYDVADAAWIELVHALEVHYLMGRDAVTDVIESLLGIDTVIASTETIKATCAAYREHPKLSFADCYLAAHATRVVALPLYTFDQKLVNQHPAARAVPR